MLYDGNNKKIKEEIKQEIESQRKNSKIKLEENKSCIRIKENQTRNS